MPAISASFSLILDKTIYDLLRKNSQNFEPSCFHNASKYPQPDYVEADQSFDIPALSIGMLIFGNIKSPATTRSIAFPLS